jgi:hypothetical protein
MDDAGLVKALDRPCHDFHKFGNFDGRELAAAAKVGQATAADEFENETRGPIVAYDVIDLHNMGIAKVRQRVGFLAKMRQDDIPTVLDRHKQFDSYQAIEFLLPRFVDHARATTSQFLQKYQAWQGIHWQCLESFTPKRRLRPNRN